jgi:hypothetical protein
MARQTPFSAVRLRLQVIVDGFNFEAVQYTSSFQVNGIPTCSITLAVGRNVKTGKRATIHDRFDSISVDDSVEVYIIPEFLGASSGAVPTQWSEALIFLGHVTGVGWQRSTGGAQFVLHAEHWCSAFNYSSALSGGSHPSNPSQFSYTAGYVRKSVGSGFGDASKPNWVPVKTSDEITADNLTGDLWANALEPFIQSVASEDPLDPDLKHPDDPADGNGLILNILDMVNSSNMGMDLGQADGDTIAKNVLTYLSGKSFSNADFHQSMWGKILEWASAFWFMVVPRVDEVLIVPNAGALRGDFWATLKTSDYVQCDMNNSMNQLIRCIGINHTVEYSYGSDTGNSGESTKDMVLKDLGAVYPVPPKKQGIAIIKEAPDWLSDPLLAMFNARASTGTADNNTSGHHDAPKGTGEEMKPMKDIKKNAEGLETILSKFAQQWYTIENLTGRYTELSGRLRFDVSPGSQVKVQAGGDPFIPDDALTQTYYAQVMRVTTLINAEQQRAGTSFNLAFVRTETENESDDFTVSSPPLYTSGWYGKSLVDGYDPDQ